MARKPSERRSFSEESIDLNLVPMMNLIGMLIPALLISAVFVEMTVVNVSAPSIGPPDPGKIQEQSSDIPLDLRVTITAAGYTVTTSGGPVPSPGGGRGGPTLPVVQKKVNCGQYVDTWPPPRPRNQSSPKCTGPGEDRTFWVYDDKGLNKILVDLKQQFPLERRVIIAAEPGTEYDALIGVMDASRDTANEKNEVQVLFDEVVLSPAPM